MIGLLKWPIRYDSIYRCRKRYVFSIHIEASLPHIRLTHKNQESGRINVTDSQMDHDKKTGKSFALKSRATYPDLLLQSLSNRVMFL